MSIDLLVHAVKSGDLDAVRRLIAEDSAIVDALTPEGVPLVRLAMYFGQSTIAEALADAGAQLDVFSAAALGRLDAVQKALTADPSLLNTPSSDGFPPLGLAAFFGRREVAAWLLEQGADPKAIADNAMRVQPLHSAAAGQHLEVAGLLLDHGADVNARQQGGFTPLHAAAQNGQIDMLDLLLERGADPALATDDGKKPVDLARDAGHEAVVTRLNEIH